MRINKEVLKSYLEYGLIDKKEISGIIERADEIGINENLRIEIIELLEKNIRSNEETIIKIDEDIEELDKKYSESFKLIRSEAKNKGRQIAKVKLEHLNTMKKQQADLEMDFDHEMNRLDRRIEEMIELKKAEFDKSLLAKVRQKIS